MDSGCVMLVAAIGRGLETVDAGKPCSHQWEVMHVVGGVTETLGALRS